MEHSERCRHCDYDGPQTIELATTGIHYAKVTCASCGRMLRWLPKPETDPTKYRRPASQRDLVAKHGRGFCEMCGTKQHDLPKGQTLEAQHVVEYQDGGSNERDNLWIVCTGCHRLIHWVRTYHGTVESIGDVLKGWPQ